MQLVINALLDVNFHTKDTLVLSSPPSPLWRLKANTGVLGSTQKLLAASVARASRSARNCALQWIVCISNTGLMQIAIFMPHVTLIALISKELSTGPLGFVCTVF